MKSSPCSTLLSGSCSLSCLDTSTMNQSNSSRLLIVVWLISAFFVFGLLIPLITWITAVAMLSCDAPTETKRLCLDLWVLHNNKSVVHTWPSTDNGPLMKINFYRPLNFTWGSSKGHNINITGINASLVNRNCGNIEGWVSSHTRHN